MVNRKKGFTLIEMIIVISILGILMALVLPKIVGVKGLGQKMQCANNMKTILQACALYVTDASISPTKISATTYKTTSNAVFGQLYNSYDENMRKWALTDMKVFACPLDTALTNPAGLRPDSWGAALKTTETGAENPSYTIVRNASGAMPDFAAEPDGNVFLIENSLNWHTGANLGFYNGSVKFYAPAATENATEGNFPHNMDATGGKIAGSVYTLCYDDSTGKVKSGTAAGTPMPNKA